MNSLQVDDMMYEIRLNKVVYMLLLMITQYNSEGAGIPGNIVKRGKSRECGTCVNFNNN